MADEPDQTKPAAAEPKPFIARVKIGDIVAFIIIAAIIVGLSIFIISRLHLKSEVTAARVVGDKAVAAMAKQNTAALRSLGDTSFQKDNSAAKLNSALTFKTNPPITFAQMYGDTKPTVDRQIVANNSRGQHVVFVYKYDKLKVPFYLRIDTIKPPSSTKWYLQALTAGTDETALTTVQK